jgi:hypothetical protein
MDMSESRPDYNRETYKKKLNLIVEYEIKMGMSKNKGDFAKKYEIRRQDLNGYLKHGHINLIFIRRLMEIHTYLTLDYLLNDTPLTKSPPKEFLPPIMLPQGQE